MGNTQGKMKMVRGILEFSLKYCLQQKREECGGDQLWGGNQEKYSKQD